MTVQHVAVIDIGKTNAKLALVDLNDLSELAVITRPNAVLAGPPWPHFDIDGHWDFLLNGLRDFHAAFGVDAISVTTHGACVALLDANGGLAAPILDYEHSGPDDVADAYDDFRPSFATTGSPRLSLGLNVGAQLFWQFRIDPTLKERTATIVTYPQYWSYRLTGVASTDVTSLGCHTDLWSPHQSNLSSLCDRLGITDKIAPTRLSGEVLGPVLPEVAARTGLPETTPVVCGIHDSNASLLPHVLGRDTPFSVVSTGTWVIAMSMGGREVDPKPEMDTLINVNALGAPVPSARFMGGREHDVLSQGQLADPTETDISNVLNAETMILPSAAPEAGPFRGSVISWVGHEPKAGSGERAVAIGFYLALVTARCLELIGHQGTIVVEGPFVRNRCFAKMLSAVTGSEVALAEGATGTSQGAAILCGAYSTGGRRPSVAFETVRFSSASHRAYAEKWQNLQTQY